MDQRVLKIDMLKLTTEERVAILNAIFHVKQSLEQRGIQVSLVKKRTPTTFVSTR